MSDTTYPRSMARLDRAVQATSLGMRRERLQALAMDLEDLETIRASTSRRTFDPFLLHDEHVLLRVGGPRPTFRVRRPSAEDRAPASS